jgi:hypothetical protein
VSLSRGTDYTPAAYQFREPARRIFPLPTGAARAERNKTSNISGLIFYTERKITSQFLSSRDMLIVFREQE